MGFKGNEAGGTRQRLVCPRDHADHAPNRGPSTAPDAAMSMVEHVQNWDAKGAGSTVLPNLYQPYRRSDDREVAHSYIPGQQREPAPVRRQ
jgi:hypothetical protein